MRLNITVDERMFEVDVEAAEPESPVLPYSVSGLSLGSAPLRVPAGVAPVAPAADSKPVNEEKVCRSPVSGIVVRVAAQVGQSLQTGDILLVLGLPAKLAALANALFPSLTVRVSEVVARWLPQSSNPRGVSGRRIEQRPPRWLTALSDRAATQNNELV